MAISCVPTKQGFYVSRDSWFRSMIHLPEYYKGAGVIFNERACIPVFGISAHRFTPTWWQIEKFEKALIAQHAAIELYWHSINPLYQARTDLDVRAHYYHYNRQYVGHINNTGDSILLVKMLNFKVKRSEIAKYYDGWEYQYITTGNNSFFWSNVENFKYNLTKDSVSVH
jgi:hypothetical protein